MCLPVPLSPVLARKGRRQKGAAFLVHPSLLPFPSKERKKKEVRGWPSSSVPPLSRNGKGEAGRLSSYPTLSFLSLRKEEPRWGGGRPLTSFCPQRQGVGCVPSPYHSLTFLSFQGKEGHIRKVPSSYLPLAFFFHSRKGRKEKGRPFLVVPLSPPSFS